MYNKSCSLNTLFVVFFLIPKIKALEVTSGFIIVYNVVFESRGGL